MEKWTLITGASEGLGAEFARIAAAEGRNLILTARSLDKLEALAKELRSDQVAVEVIKADLSDLAEVERLWETASTSRQIDVLINNAGLGCHGNFGNGEAWERELSSLNVNITALSYLMKQAIPHMQAASGGRIQNVSSVAAFMPGPHMAVYHATKAYVLSLSQAVAEELSGTNVTVTALCPGPTATKFFDGADMHGVRLLRFAKKMEAAPVAQAGWDAAKAGQRVTVPGFANKVLAFAPRLTPSRLLTFISSKVMGKST